MCSLCDSLMTNYCYVTARHLTSDCVCVCVNRLTECNVLADRSISMRHKHSVLYMLNVVIKGLQVFRTCSDILVSSSLVETAF